MTDLQLLTLQDLQRVCRTSKLKYEPSTSKDQLVKILKQQFKELDKKSFAKIRKLGIPGKEGTVWAIKYKSSLPSPRVGEYRSPDRDSYSKKEYALKQFKSTKSSKEIIRESDLQKITAKAGISPKVIEVDILSKFIVMELLPGETLFDTLKKSNGVMTISEQKDFVRLIEKLDKIGVYHGDPSPLNFIYDNKKILKVIDFGFGKKMEKGEKDTNMKSMLLGFILKMKQIGVDVDKNYSYIKKYIDSGDLEKCGIKKI
jgi:tRNA A-37 threonylcarbamoyl transferase component Bud32